MNTKSHRLNKKTLIKKTLITCIIAVSAQTVTFADDNAPTKCDPQAGTDTVICAVNNLYSAVYSKVMTSFNLQTFGSNNQYNASMGTVSGDTQAQSLKMTQSNLQLLGQDNSKAVAKLSIGLPASDSPQLKSNQGLFGILGHSISPKVGDLSLTASNLFDPESYAKSSDEGLAANNFIQFLSHNTDQLDQVDYSSLDGKPDKMQQLQEDPDYQSYKIDIRAILADRSVGLSNLQYLVNERTVQSGLGAKAGMPSAYKDASPLQVAQFLADRRIDNPRWVAQMNSASLTTLERQSLFTAAEIRAQLYQNHLDQERILMTLSTMSLQQNQNQKTALITQVQSIQKKVDSLGDTNNSSASDNKGG